MAQLTVTPDGPSSWRVEVADDDGRTTSHLVSVPADLMADLGLESHREEELVHESFFFLLARAGDVDHARVPARPDRPVLPGVPRGDRRRARLAGTAVLHELLAAFPGSATKVADFATRPHGRQ